MMAEDWSPWCRLGDHYECDDPDLCECPCHQDDQE